MLLARVRELKGITSAMFSSAQCLHGYGVGVWLDSTEKMIQKKQSDQIDEEGRLCFTRFVLFGTWMAKDL